jgi:hypothetical protein
MTDTKQDEEVQLCGRISEMPPSFAMEVIVQEQPHYFLRLDNGKSHRWFDTTRTGYKFVDDEGQHLLEDVFQKGLLQRGDHATH